MITKDSPTRLTLALDIIRQLESGPLSGYHELGIIKHQISLADTLHVEPWSCDFVECDNPLVPIDGRNICLKACELVRKQFGIEQPLRIIIDKRIPVMGGMAGGSANAAAMLRILDELWELNLTHEQFCGLGRQLGMDVPFFFTGKTAFDSEATGVLEPVAASLKFYFVLALPDFGVSTKEAYGSLDYSGVGKDIFLTTSLREALSRGDSAEAARYVHNDFEKSVFKRFPKLEEIRSSLIKAGCAAAGMSGSGSTLYGIASDKAQAQKVAASIDCRTIITETLL
ncbi:MAG: 4-(cytidine 5'-diphospho)-2-C-methyl-D-erythritol kinase [Chitinispirillales bacterium]|jgi:4-diphosphocytidyl-2-C-methyl-D-erythritol kinase|nr:4-(cytidine 5'-diphospho)-2-C-methyl-D-erythritol kinase [Chitinispirillales bacterium]